MRTSSFCALSSSMLAPFISAAPQVPKEPDFSGECVSMKTNRSTAEQASALTVRQTITRTTLRGEPMKPWFSNVSIEHRFERGVESETYSIGTIGGIVPAIPEGASSSQGEWTTTDVNWRGSTLVIATTRSSQRPGESGPYTAHEEVG